MSRDAHRRGATNALSTVLRQERARRSILGARLDDGRRQGCRDASAVSLQSSVAVEVGRALGLRVGENPRRVTGGSINDAWRYDTERGPIFVKVSDLAAQEMFAAEADGLEALASATAVRTPNVQATGSTHSHAWLALEWIDFAAETRGAERMLGEALARQHRVVGARYGWHRHNTIGSTQQRNDWRDDWRDDWPSFLREHRLGFQLDLALARGARARVVDRGRRLCEGVSAFFKSYTPVPSLLHGDLWGGNWARLRPASR